MTPKRRLGRPPKTQAGARVLSVCVRMHQAELDRLLALRREGEDRTDTVRRLVEEEYIRLLEQSE